MKTLVLTMVNFSKEQIYGAMKVEMIPCQSSLPSLSISSSILSLTATTFSCLVFIFRCIFTKPSKIKKTLLSSSFDQSFALSFLIVVSARKSLCFREKNFTSHFHWTLGTFSAYLFTVSPSNWTLPRFWVYSLLVQFSVHILDLEFRTF